MVNGYVTLDLASNKIYNESLNAIKSGKPVMVVDAPNVYFADTIKVATIDDDKVVVITKGGKTITINDANAVSSEGTIQPSTSENHLYNVSGELFVWTTDDKASRFYIEALSTNGSSVIISDSTTYAELYAFMQSLTNIKVNLNTDSKVDDAENIYEVWLEIADNNIKINYILSNLVLKFPFPSTNSLIIDD